MKCFIPGLLERIIGRSQVSEMKCHVHSSCYSSIAISLQGSSLKQKRSDRMDRLERFIWFFFFRNLNFFQGALRYIYIHSDWDLEGVCYFAGSSHSFV